MTLTDVLTTMHTQGRIHPSRLKDMQTSIRKLARALGKERPEQCQQDDFLLTESVWKEKLEIYFASLDKKAGAETRRNTRTNLRFLFRMAHEAGLITPPQFVPLLPGTRQQHTQLALQTSPYRDRWRAARQTPYKLPQHAWPADIQTAWQHYADSRQLKTRQASLTMYNIALSAYIGFLINIEGLAIHWDDLFDIASLDRFVRWHSGKQQVRISDQAQKLARTLRLLAAHGKHPVLPALKDYIRDLPTPEPMHNKRRHWFTLRELEMIGLSELQDARKPLIDTHSNANPGLMRALDCQHALMLRLLVRIPLRSRNLREIQLDKNLYHDQGHWHLHFSGEELKVATRNGETNEYHINMTEYCPDLLPHLEEYLTIHHPRIPNTETSPLLFRSKYGNPYNASTLRHELFSLVFRRSDKKRFYPHLIRTIWATEYLTANPGDYEGAAAMLGDTVQMVLKSYYHLDVKRAHARGSQFLTAALR
jgi:hypothetical protein